MITLNRLAVLLLATTLASTQLQAQSQTTTPLAAPTSLPGEKLSPPSVAQLMQDTVNPAAVTLWQAVSYTVTAEQTTETMPTTEADWQHLREQAERLMQSAVALMMPALPIAAGRPATDRPGFQFSPVEIERLRTREFDDWRRYAQQLQTTTLQLLTTIERRDVAAYVEAGPPLNQVCEGCHGQFWYRPLGMERP